jgi:hypothetical protein
MIGEKSSLRNELLSVAQMADAELILPTGDISNTLIAGIVRRIIDDGRPAVILYFADFDRHNMPTAVARKVQALLTLWGYDSYDVPIQMHRAGLTRNQVRRLDLPSSPLKPGERRRDRWIGAMGHEQTELDALIVLRPGELGRIAEQAVAPFRDPTLDRRCREMTTEWREQIKDELEDNEDYQAACDILKDAYARVELHVEAAQQHVDAANAELEDARTRAEERIAELISEVHMTFEAPEPDIDESEQPEPLFTTDDDFVTATQKLLAEKAYAGATEDGDDDDGDDGDEEDE